MRRLAASKSRSPGNCSFYPRRRRGRKRGLRREISRPAREVRGVTARNEVSEYAEVHMATHAQRPRSGSSDTREAGKDVEVGNRLAGRAQCASSFRNGVIGDPAAVH